MIAGRRLWRAGLAVPGALAGMLMIGMLSYANGMTPRPNPGPLVATPVPLDAANPQNDQLGVLRYAGGLSLSAGASTRFGGLSGLLTAPDGTDGLVVTSQSDEGQIFRFKATLDAAGRLAGASDLVEAGLHDEHGALLGRGKDRGDAEDIAQGEAVTYISLEFDNRVLAMADPFAPNAAVARLALPAQALVLPQGEGLEALAVANIGGKPVLALGAEDGRIWLCPAQTSPQPDCRQILKNKPAPFFNLTALRALPGSEDFVALYRAFDPIRGWRARVEHLTASNGVYSSHNLAKLSPPMTVDNMEGLSVLPGADGVGWRLYLVSDDNFRDEEHTLLLAFDWKP